MRCNTDLKSGEKLPFLDQVYQGDVMDLIKQLPDSSIDCVYADPDYNVGRRYNDKSYTKAFGEYIDWCKSWARESHRVLKHDGNFFVINYPKNNAYLRTGYLDQAFYAVNEYVWVYNTNIGHSKRRFTTAHRSILHCTKSKNNKFYKENVLQDYKNPTDKRIKKLMNGGVSGRMPYSWLNFNLVKNVNATKSFHSCQIPEGLSRTLIASCTRPNDIVLILFGGSGSEVIECMKLKLHYITAEIDKQYYHLIKRRLEANGEVPRKYRMIELMRG